MIIKSIRVNEKKYDDETVIIKFVLRLPGGRRKHPNITKSRLYVL